MTTKPDTKKIEIRYCERCGKTLIEYMTDIFDTYTGEKRKALACPEYISAMEIGQYLIDSDSGTDIHISEALGKDMKVWAQDHSAFFINQTKTKDGKEK